MVTTSPYKLTVYPILTSGTSFWEFSFAGHEDDEQAMTPISSFHPLSDYRLYRSFHEFFLFIAHAHPLLYFMSLSNFLIFQ